MNACHGLAASVFMKYIVSILVFPNIERRLHTLPDGSVEMSTLRTVTEEEAEVSMLGRMNRANGWGHVKG